MKLFVEQWSDPVDLLSVQQADAERFPYLLESTLQGEHGRYDILFAYPQYHIKLDHQYQIRGQYNDFLSVLDEHWEKERQDFEGIDLPFQGGWFIYLSYELAAQIEPSLILTVEENQPIAYASRIPAAIIKDHLLNITWLVAEKKEDIKRLHNAIKKTPQPVHRFAKINSDLIEESADDYLQKLANISEYIMDGDVFQVNLSRLWQLSSVNANIFQLYSLLRQSNPAPFAGLACFENYTIISSSPERLIKVKGKKIETRPIAGTLARKKQQTTQVVNTKLLKNLKEQAEHVMLIDLERNDLGRICKAGTVIVDEKMSIENYAHVHHIVSNISGQLKTSITPGEIIRAVFPGGTITGCPKVRCMQIIAELERTYRGAYTGSMGYLNHQGDMDFNILIRTYVKSKKHVTFRAGAGIVADSIAINELAETRAKAKGLLNIINNPRHYNNV